ncbi:MAG TPA: hypothetical protein VL693_08515 [Vicinamibacterales bacterium]|jgi:CHASE3 domain sensor protein|nr:hypothetical protein [Vicinamibacterales bacterium]
MQRHTTRFIVVVLLIAAGAIGGFFVFTSHQRALAIDAASRDVAARADQMIATAGEIAAAQRAYVAPGQPNQPWLERCATLLQQFGQDAAAIRALLTSSEAIGTLADIDKQFKAVVVVDDKARQDLQEEQTLLAADLIFSEGQDTVAAMMTALRNVKSSEERTAGAQRAVLEQQQIAALGGIAVLWALGLVLLARSGSRSGSGTTESGSVNFSRLAPDPGSRISDPVAAPPMVDLAAAADVCGALARATDTASLHAALTHAAAVLDARGIIVWMGAGEELFPALSVGYDERVVERLGPIPRNASNATADAWRGARLRTVPGDVMAHGAIAAPVHGVSGCVGVFAAEVRHGREADPGTQAVAAMVAAQLAGLVSAWPSASAGVHKTA